MDEQKVTTWTVVVERPPEEVFAYLADIPRHAEWSPKPYRAEDLSEGPAGVGKRYRSIGWLPGKPHNENHVEITAYEPPRRLTFRAVEGDATLTHEFVLTPQGPGTRVDRNVGGFRPTGVARLMWPALFPLLVRPGIQKGMDLLKQRLEAPRE